MNHAASLKRVFSSQIVRWTLIGLLGSALLGILLVAGFGVISTEDYLHVTAEAAAKAFRPQILSGETRDSEIQIRDAFHLKPNESVVIRDPHFKRIYALAATSPQELTMPSCSIPGKTCWYLGKYQVSTLVPIYFDGEHKELFGYLELNLTPRFDFGLMLALFFAICAGSLIQGIGMCSRFVGLAGSVGSQLKNWADRIRENPKTSFQSDAAPFEELRAMQDALIGLNREISRLEEEARDSAKLSIIRGISHDILSPVSQLQKLLAAWSLSAKQGSAPEPELIVAIQRVLRRLTAIAQQTKLLRQDCEVTQITDPLGLDIARETSSLLGDLRKDFEIEDKGIAFVGTHSDSSVLASVAPEDYLRIVDNLVRNAVHASKPGGKIEVRAFSEKRVPVLLIKDEGCGIPKHIQTKVFDLNFTTRPGLGTGLGLAIVKQLCARNQAKVHFVSEPGVGTEFRVEFRPAQPISEVSA